MFFQWTCFLSITIFLIFTAEKKDSVVPEIEKLHMEGRIDEKLECRPHADDTYMKLKLESIKKACEPVRKVKQLDRIVLNYKPVSDHRHNVSSFFVFKRFDD